MSFCYKGRHYKLETLSDLPTVQQLRLELRSSHFLQCSYRKRTKKRTKYRCSLLWKLTKQFLWFFHAVVWATLIISRHIETTHIEFKKLQRLIYIKTKKLLLSWRNYTEVEFRSAQGKILQQLKLVQKMGGDWLWSPTIRELFK